jgi:hypothetical protein
MNKVIAKQPKITKKVQTQSKNIVNNKQIKIKNGITIPAPKRSYQFGGKYWIPNGIDKVYRIINNYHGQALTAFGDHTPVHTQQFRSDWFYLHDYIFEKTDTEGVYYIANYDYQNKIHYLSTDNVLEQIRPVELTEIKVYASKNINDKPVLLTSKDITVTMTEPYNDSMKGKNALDGNLGTLAVTKIEPNTWILFNLQKSNYISEIEIDLRDWSSFSMRNALVSILDANKKTVWSTRLVGSRTVHDLNFKNKKILGQYIKLEQAQPKNHPPYLSSTFEKNEKGKLWRIELVDKIGLYKIISVKNGLAIQAPVTNGPDLRSESHVPVQLVPYKENDPSMQWFIEPVRNKEMDCLAASQIGWTPKATKNAILVRTKKLKSDPEFFVTKSKKDNSCVLIKKGKAKFVDTRFKLFYYKIDVTDINQPGDYNLDCDGDRIILHIDENAYLNIRHRGGSDTIHLNNVITGFVKHWGRLDNWCKMGADSFNVPYWQLQDPKTGKLSLKLPKKRIPAKFIGGWDHTDRAYSALQPSAAMLQNLVLTFFENNQKKLNKPLINEIKYGTEYFIKTQSQDGTWPLHTYIANVYTGTVASVGLSLTLASQALKQYDKNLSDKAMQAAKKAWKWVEENPDKWVPSPVTYRHGHSEERVMFAIEQYLATGDENCKKIADEMILNSKIDYRGAWIKSVGSFKGQTTDSSRTYALLLTFMRYYPKANDKVKAIINKEIDTYYQKITTIGLVGVFGIYEGGYSGYGYNSAWLSNACLLYKTFIFKNKDKKYIKGYSIAENVMNYLFGNNEYATSMVFGFGDIFAVPGWMRPYEIGSVMPGLAAKLKNGQWLEPKELTTSFQGYGNSESEADVGVRLVYSMLLRNKLKDTEVK